jgi:hypothetical protein
MASRKQQAAQRAVNAQAKRNNQQQTKQRTRHAPAPSPQMKVWSQMDRQSLVTAPTARGHIQLGSGPMFMSVKSSSSGLVRIRHREYITDVLTGSTGSVFTVAQFLGINPGLASTFPWLSGVANKFESYRFRSLRFLLESQVPTSTNGAMFMAIDFDAADPQPNSKQQMMTYKTSVRSPIWTDCCCQPNPEELHKLGPEKFVRQGALAANLDIRTADVGNLIVATVAGSTGLAAAELYVEYDVELITPLYEPGAQAVAATGKLVCSGTIAAATPFGNGAVTQTGGILAYPTATGNGLGFLEAGEYLVIVESTGTVFTDTLPVLTAANGNVVTMLSGTLNHNAAATAATCYFAVRVNFPGVLTPGTNTIATGFQNFTLSYAADSTTYTATTVRIAPYGYTNA